MVDLPLGATEDRVCGTIDIEKALSEGGWVGACRRHSLQSRMFFGEGGRACAQSAYVPACLHVTIYARVQSLCPAAVHASEAGVVCMLAFTLSVFLVRALHCM